MSTCHRKKKRINARLNSLTLHSHTHICTVEQKQTNKHNKQKKQQKEPKKHIQMPGKGKNDTNVVRREKWNGVSSCLGEGRKAKGSCSSSGKMDVNQVNFWNGSPLHSRRSWWISCPSSYLLGFSKSQGWDRAVPQCPASPWIIRVLIALSDFRQNQTKQLPSEKGLLPQSPLQGQGKGKNQFLA